MEYDFLIFGGTGQQGSICARDLIESGYSVLLAGREKERIKQLLRSKKTGFIRVDLRNENEIVKAIKKSGANVVINCAELDFNIAIMKACLKTKKPLTDLGGLQEMTIEQFKLNKEFKKAGIINLTGCGSTPGIANVMVKHAIEKLDKVETIHLGFAWDSNVKKFVIPYSIPSIFYEMTSDPITFHNGKFIKENRMTCMGKMKFKEVGVQTVYCIVHSEVYTFSKYFKNKGIKNIHYLAGFPEHSLKPLQSLIELGFGKKEKILIDGKEISPLKFIIKVLRKIEIPKDYEETEDIWARISGTKKGKKVKLNLDCIVKTLSGWESAGSNVDTGRTISVMSQMIKEGVIKETGVHAPEGVIPCELFFKELSKRKMYIYENGKRIN